MIRATKKWLSIKITSGILIPFMVWFILNLVGIISEVFEDYISNFKLKNAANRLLVFFSIIVTLILITFLFKI